MNEQFCDVGRGITLCYESFGYAGDPTALLIMGLGTQMVAWHEDFCRELAARGLHVVRFDNRDIGHSTHLQGPPPTLAQLLRRSRRAARYTLADMADDAAGCYVALELAPAHVIGASMGGMIAQTLAARRPALGALARVDHVQHRQPPQRPALAAPLPVLPAPPAERARGVDRAYRAPVHRDRLLRPAAATTRTSASSPQPATTATTTRRARASARGDHRLRQPHRRAGTSPPRRS